MDKRGPLRLNLEEILRKRIDPSVFRWIPSAAVRMLERIIRQDELNAILEAVYPARGSEFSRKALDYLDVSVEVSGRHNLPPLSDRCVFVSNHPLGGLDGVALVALLGGVYGDDNIRFLVNDMLKNVTPLADVFLPVNKYGTQARESAKLIASEYSSSRQIIIFPAGLVSRLGEGGEIKDLEWKKAFMTKALETGRNIVPIHFIGHNSSRFYRLARWRKRLGIKVNIEQIMLPGELCGSRGKRFRIVIGEPVSVSDLQASGKTPEELSRMMREKVYSIS